MKREDIIQIIGKGGYDFENGFVVITDEHLVYNFCAGFSISIPLYNIDALSVNERDGLTYLGVLLQDKTAYTFFGKRRNA